MFRKLMLAGVAAVGCVVATESAADARDRYYYYQPQGYVYSQPYYGGYYAPTYQYYTPRYGYGYSRQPYWSGYRGWNGSTRRLYVGPRGVYGRGPRGVVRFRF